MTRFFIVSHTFVLAWLALGWSAAAADLGSCRVLNQSTQVSRHEFAKLRTDLYQAFDKSPANDGSYIFIIDIQPELGADVFRLTHGVVGSPSYTITGGSVKALRAGVAEFARWFQRFGREPLNEGRQKAKLAKPGSQPPTIPVTATLSVDASKFAETGQLPMTITVTNGLDADLNYSSFGVEALPWNGETASISLVNIHREGEERLAYESSPIIDVPRFVSGPSNRTIRPGETLTIKSDAAKWKIRDGWKPGQYTVDARVENLSVDEGRCILTVMTKPIRFEIK